MRNHAYYHTKIGGLFFLACVLFFSYIYIQKPSKKSSKLNTPTLEITGEFQRVDGLRVGDDVRLAGMLFGSVTDLALDENFLARVTLEISNQVPLPNDSTLNIESDGIFGAKYVEIIPGGSFDPLKEGDHIDITQDALIVDELLARIVSMAKTNRGISVEEPTKKSKDSATKKSEKKS